MRTEIQIEKTKEVSNLYELGQYSLDALGWNLKIKDGKNLITPRSHYRHMLLSAYLSFRFAGQRYYIPKISFCVVLISLASTIPISPWWYILGGPLPFLSIPAYSVVDKVWAPDYGDSEPGWVWVHKTNILTITLNWARLESLDLPFHYFSRTINYFLLANSLGAVFGGILGCLRKSRVLNVRRNLMNHTKSEPF